MCVSPTEKEWIEEGQELATINVSTMGDRKYLLL
jgi:hypothetical protein